MSDKIFLQEITATVAYVDIRRFSPMVAQLSPMDLGIALGRYYEHVEDAVVDHDGRIVKFMYDHVLALFPSISGKDHAGNGMAALQHLRETADAWLAENEKMGLPVMEYSSGLASGSVLFGELGTDRQRAHDALGQPVMLAIRLARLASERDTPHLISASTVQIARQSLASIEVDGAEISGLKLRIFRLLAKDETKARPGGEG
jgi:class 3 adenylate cyclase